MCVELENEKMNTLIIGILGGMGTYATINAFEQYASVFAAEKEWDRPRLIVDNRCTMPSRVRAFIYNEKKEELIDEMTESVSLLMNSGCNRIILACNTSHLFLDDILRLLPEASNCIVDIIDACVDELKNIDVKEVGLLASEGTIESKIYQDRMLGIGTELTIPSQKEYDNIRLCIEAVKQNMYTDEVKKVFLSLINRYDACILGCTELPILYKKYKDDIECKVALDPVLCALKKIKRENCK